jgi:hypothetical protein
MEVIHHCNSSIGNKNRDCCNLLHWLIMNRRRWQHHCRLVNPLQCSGANIKWKQISLEDFNSRNGKRRRETRRHHPRLS